MTAQANSDIIVLGGGPGGYVAAIRASQLGAKVTLVEKDKIGGTCTNTGCIPTKALISITELLASSKQLTNYGVNMDYSQLNYAKFLQDAITAAKESRVGIEFLLNKNHVNVIYGYGRLLDHKRVEVNCINGEKHVIEASSIIIATGSAPLIPSIPGIDNSKVVTNENIFERVEKPEKLVILGGGTEGVEWAVVFNRIGTKVTLIESAAQILPEEDEQLTKYLRNVFEREGVRFKTGAKVTKIDNKDDELEVTLDNGESIYCNQILVAVGRVPNITGYGIDDLVEINKGKIVVDNHMRTKTSNIYAIGDVVGKWMLAHVAMQEGIVAAENALSRDRIIDYCAVPRCIYTDPEAAFIGLSEKEAVENKDWEVKTAVFPLSASGRARTMRRRFGSIKLVYDSKTFKLLGSHIVSTRATELIGGLGVALHLNANLNDIVETMYPHPTISEVIKEAALKGLGRELHI
jgi:dihydrolipoamide dehydrogenase